MGFLAVSSRTWRYLPSLKLTAHTWKWMVGRRSFPFGARPIFRGELLVSGSVCMFVLLTLASNVFWVGTAVDIAAPLQQNIGVDSSSFPSMSSNYQLFDIFWGDQTDQTMQRYGNFEGFSLSLKLVSWCHIIRPPELRVPNDLKGDSTTCFCGVPFMYPP